MTDHPIIGDGQYRYRFERNWGKLPRWWSFSSTQAGPPQTAVHGAVAANGDVYVLARSDHPVMVFDGDGNFISSWGEGRFSAFVHGICIAPDGNVWIIDSGNHTVIEHAPDGTALRTLGTANSPAPTFWGRPFNMPTGVAFAPDGTFYVSDGYGNRRVHHYGADATLLDSWGEPGNGPGQFALVHFIEVDAKGQVYIADRENDRIQVFAPDGRFIADWTDFKAPSDLAFGANAIVVGGHDGLSIWTQDRKLLARWPRDTTMKDGFNIHGVWLDAEENIFLAQFDRVVSKLTRVR